MKKSRLLLFIAFFLFALVGIVFYAATFYKPSIVKILESDAYSYLSEEAKEYIKTVYKETGEVIRTEKNKEANMPYLNPKYAAYLSATPEEKEQMEIVPVAYSIDFVSLAQVEASLPSYYNISNINSNSYISPAKNQYGMGICWSFAAAEQVESLLMWKSRTPYNSSSQLFSVRQIDYAASSDGIQDYTNEDGMRQLGEGGNFLTSTVILANGLGLMSESDMPFSTSMSKKELSNVFNYSKSLYELDSSVFFPINKATTSSTDLQNNVKLIKQYIMDYAGVYVETESPDRSCDFVNTDGSHIIRVDDGCTQDSGHAMQIIGWDDNYTYSYCKLGSQHASYGCTNSNRVSGKGA